MNDPPEGEPRRAAPSSKTLRTRLFIGIFLGLLVYAGMVLWADAGAIGAALADFPFILVPAAMGLSFLNYVVRFARWERYRGLLGIRMGRRTSFLIYLAGLSLTVTPGKMGEAFKSFLIRRVDGTPVHVSAPIVVAERFTDLLALLALVGIGGLATVPENAWIFWSTLGLCGVLLTVFCSERLAGLACDLLERTPLPGQFAPRLAQRARGAFQSARVLLTPRELIVPTIVATFGWSLECFGFWLIANALAGGELPLLFAIYAFALSAVAGAVLILFPGGLGVTEGTLSGLLDARYRLLGVAPEAARAKAASATILIRLCTLWFAVGIGLAALALFSREQAAAEAKPPA